MSRPRTSSYKASSASNFYTRKLHLQRRPKLPVDAISWRIRPGLSHGSCHVNIIWAPLKMRSWAASQSLRIRPLSTTRPIGRKTKGTASLPLHKPMHCFTYARLEYMPSKTCVSWSPANLVFVVFPRVIRIPWERGLGGVKMPTDRRVVLRKAKVTRLLPHRRAGRKVALAVWSIRAWRLRCRVHHYLCDINLAETPKILTGRSSPLTPMLRH